MITRWLHKKYWNLVMHNKIPDDKIDEKIFGISIFILIILAFILDIIFIIPEIIYYLIKTLILIIKGE